MEIDKKILLEIAEDYAIDILEKKLADYEPINIPSLGISIVKLADGRIFEIKDVVDDGKDD